MAIVEKIYLKENDIWNQKKQIDLHTCELKGDRGSVSFITSKGNNRLINDRVRGFCHIKFKANFVVEGIDVDNLAGGELLQIGDAVIKITKVRKECYIDCPIIKKFNTLCAVNEQIFFGEVLEAGIVKEKDSITFLPLL